MNSLEEDIKWLIDQSDGGEIGIGVLNKRKEIQFYYACCVAFDRDISTTGKTPKEAVFELMDTIRNELHD